MKTEYKRIDAKECAERLLSIEDPLVVMHARPDGDTVGSGVALCLILEALGKRVCYACSHEIPKRLAFIVDGVRRAEESELSSLSAVAVDVASPAQLGDLRDKINPCLMIDHHEVGEAFADNYVIPGASSAAEVVYTVLEELVKQGRLVITKKIASALYTAISSDTGGFMFSNTSPLTMRRAAALMELGIDFADINHRLFHSKSPEQIKAEGFTASRVRTTDGGRIAYATITLSDRDELGISNEHFETAIDVVRSVAGAEIAFIVKETERGVYKGSLRSTGADVARVAAEFSGGGHVRAAGCTIEAGSIEEAAELLLKTIRRQTNDKNFED